MEQEIRVYAPIVSRFRLDGGAMFGVVPRVVWQSIHPPDDDGRVDLVSRILLVHFPSTGRLVLVDGGIGDLWPLKQQTRYSINCSPNALEKALVGLGLTLSQVTDVIVTHLHFDHIGGLFYQSGNGDVLPVFQDATYHIQRKQWNWAQSPSKKDRVSYRQDWLPLFRGLDIHLVDGPCTLFDNVQVETADGHTPGMQMPVFMGASTQILFPSDLFPTTAHIRLPWIMAYDVCPLETLKEKERILKKAVKNHWCMVLLHDPSTEAVTIRAEGDSFNWQERACPSSL